ncbi:MAG: cell wall-binding repeat-containing protein [Lachnospiraceae bacterium]|nr:cell wall-binding repeat-containing protein [Lachnospiraceae bacterium]
MKKKITISLTLAGLLAMSAQPVMATPASVASNGRPLSGYVETIIDENEPINLEEALNRAAAEADDSLPEAFSLITDADELFGKEAGYFTVPEHSMSTPIKDQDPFGVCWSFGAMASAESGMLMNGTYTDATDAAVDFSEVQAAYHGIITNAGQEPIGTEGDISMSSDWANNGGTLLWVMRSWSKGYGLIKDASLPYERLKNDGDPVENELAAGQYATAFNTEHMVNGIIGQFDDVNHVKDLIMTKGAASFAMYFEPEYESDSAQAYYRPQYSGSNHLVNIVGWDDHYDRENFGRTTLEDPDRPGQYLEPVRPENDGAWLIKTSWGQYNNIGGYFWMSYEDGAFTKASVNWLEGEPISEKNSVIYQHDGGVNLRYLKSDNPDVDHIWQAAVFTARDNDRLNAVSFWCFNQTDTAYEIRVYRGIVSDQDPTDGILIEEATTSGVITDRGYREIPLATPVTVKKGETFSVVVCFNNEEEGPLFIQEHYSNNIDQETGEYREQSLVAVERGENFVSYGVGYTENPIGWYDVVDAMSGGGNLTIKAIGGPLGDEEPDPLPVHVKRLGGADRYETASLIAQEAFGNESVEEVVIVTGRNFPDALSAGGYAGFYKCPILISNENRVNEHTADALNHWRESLKRITVIGDTFKPAFYQELMNLTGLEQQPDNKRAESGIFKLAGKDRYETSMAVFKTLLADPNFDPSIVFITTGKKPADALSASSVAYRYGYPILLSRKNGLTDEGRRLILNNNMEEVILGSVENCNDWLMEKFVRVAGSDRYETSKIFAEYSDKYFDNGKGYVNLALAAGADANYPDALVGGMLLGRKGGQIVLVRGKTAANNPYPEALLKNHLGFIQGQLQHLYVLGSDQAVSDETVNRLAGILENKG